MKRKASALLFVLLAAMAVTLSGCGGGPKADVSVFMMNKEGMPQEAADMLKTGLAGKIGAAPTVDLVASPLFSLEKMMVELAAGGHDVFVLPAEQFTALAKQGGLVPLENLVNKDDYKSGIVESNDQGKIETHLYGLPLDDAKWFKDAGFAIKGLVAFIPSNTKHLDNAKTVIQKMAAK